MRPFWAPIWPSLQKSVKAMFKSFRDSDVISSSVSGLRGVLARAGVSKPEKNSSSPIVRRECVYKSVRKRSGSQLSTFEMSARTLVSK
jgi:hypothetical protein